MSSKIHPVAAYRTTFTTFVCLAVLSGLAGQAEAQPAARRERGNFGTLMMTTPDGRSQACELRSLHVRVAIAGDMARTEVEQVFANPLDRDMEGTFDFELPPGAAVNRLALEINGKLVDGELVERQLARLVYEKIVRSMRDPALMEWQSGDRFKTQIYPVPAHGTKRVVLAYLTQLTSRAGKMEYRYSLPAMAEGQSPIGDFSFSARLSGQAKASITPYDAAVNNDQASFTKKQFRPRGDMILRVEQPAAGSKPLVRVIKAGQRRLFSIQLAPNWKVSSRKLPRDVVILADSSGSMRGRGFAELINSLDQILSALGPKDRVRLISGDLDIHKFGGFLPAAGSKKIRGLMRSMEPGGGTNLEKLLLAGAIRPPAGRRSMAIYMGDGQASLGELDGDLLTERVVKAYRRAKAELNVVAVGNGPAVDFLQKLSRACMGSTLAKEPGRALDLKPFIRSLDQPLLSGLKLSSRGDCARGVLPGPLPNLARGERLEIMGQLEGRRACKIRLSGEVAGKPFSLAATLDPSRAESSMLLPVFWARKRIAHLERVAGDRREIVSLSKEFGIMCRYTSWLVLENDQAYKQHRIKRTQHDQQATTEAPAKNVPLKKAKLAKGESVSDFLQKFKDDKPASEPAMTGAASGGEEDKAEKKEMAAPRMEESRRSLQAPSPVMKVAEMEAPAGPSSPKPMTKSRAKAKKPAARPRPVPFEQLLAQAERDVADRPDEPYRRENLVSLAVDHDKIDVARKHIDAWTKKFSSDPDKLVRLVLPALDRLPQDDWSLRRRLEIYRLALDARPSDRQLLSGMVDALVRSGKKQEAFDLVEKRRRAAKKDPDMLLALIPAYGRLSSMPQAREALLKISGALIDGRPLDIELRRTYVDQLKEAGMKDAALAAIADWRRYAPDFPSLVIEQVELLRESLKLAQAERVLSELVEFSPHSYEARTGYAAKLAEPRGFAKAGQPEQACAQYTRAVQLNPSKRETFRTMMALRRSHPKAAKKIGRCIVDGVSRLPVIRDVSIVMLWEDPSADVDMHVIEPGGDEVWYQHLESNQGGHLYYDVTDGLGPEIYVLGSGKPGSYRLSVVYYSGSAKTVSGKMIVMRHAGGPEETRKVYPFTLQGADSNKKIPVGVFKISR
ncbi:MAG TPA: VIT domain-containing protein [Myxococcota bacterium]|nr:VIT domain-containing protein [Myxococcota bacterium]